MRRSAAALLLSSQVRIPLYDLVIRLLRLLYVVYEAASAKSWSLVQRSPTEYVNVCL